MLDRFSASVATATILAVLGKVALLYHEDQEQGVDWFDNSNDQTVQGYLLLAVFLMFLRGKMMHDDATFFADLETEGAFKDGKGPKFLIKVGLLLGYISWLLWAPAIYFLEDVPRFAGFLIGSLVLSTAWLLIDIVTRKQPEWRRVFWILPNAAYIALLALAYHGFLSFAALGLLVVLLLDWLSTDPMSGHV